MLATRSLLTRAVSVATRTSRVASIATRLPTIINKLNPITSVLRPIQPHAYFHSTGMELPETKQKVESYFGCNVFDKKTMKAHIGSMEFERFEQLIRSHRPIDPAMADVIATALLKWAQERGATHYTHWFQPITGAGAEKHDTFLDTARDGETPITRFSSKQLILGEPDGSSFPSGGLRATHVARGYTAWDPQSSPFILTHDNGATLYIPCLFFSWSNGQALDEKTVLLRSEYALSRETIRLFKVLGDGYDQHKYIHTDAGLEQEFFLIDREYYLKRPDLVATGRTLFGAAPAKAQQLEDQYFGHISHKALNAIHEFEVEAWKLGIPIQTRHREVAPGQYEVAPKFAPANIGTDRNLVMMDLLRKIARKHGLAALLHEKPFRGVNGSGKHNNWSLGSNITPSLLNPGDNPQTNTLFMFFLAATVRAVDTHADLMRVAIAGAGNDHRLGANEAPPAIVSCYLGDDILAATQRFISADKSPSTVDLTVQLGIPTVPTITRNATDRNRTSTFAFTGNKFEFRAVGSSHNPSRSNQVLNTIIASSIKEMTNEIEAAKKNGLSSTDAINKVARDTLRKHQRILFDGNGYAPEWAIEAEKRGLLNLRTTPQALAYLNTPKNQKLFQEMGVLSGDELEARTSVLYEEYIKKVTIEGDLAAELAFTTIAPVAYETQRDIAASIQQTEIVTKRTSTVQRQQLDKIDHNINELLSQAELLRKYTHDAHHAPNLVEGAAVCEKFVIPTMFKVRLAADALERLVPAAKWPMPTYAQMMFEQD